MATKQRIIPGDCIEVMAAMEPEMADAIVTDPPYGLSFMGKGWDHGVPGVEFWIEALRVAKPGAHLLAFGGTRTYHRLACAIEDAGWEVRDCVMWVYGSGFPKSHDVSKAIDKAAGAEREAVGEKITGRALGGSNWRDGNAGGQEMVPITAPATDAAKHWQGWGTALKPAWEPIIVARKPLCGTVAENVLRHGTGAINVDGCRVGAEAVTVNTWNDGAKPFGGGAGHEYTGRTVVGRWPANVIHDGSDEVVGLFPDTGKSTGGRTVKRSGGGNVGSGKSSQAEWSNEDPGYGDSGSASRFFYCAKANKADRDEGSDGRNTHPTVKPTDLMRYLCRLVTPPGGVVLDPFCGSGSTGKGAILEGFRFVGVEREAEYVAVAERRIMAARKRMALFEATA